MNDIWNRFQNPNESRLNRLTIACGAEYRTRLLEWPTCYKGYNKGPFWELNYEVNRYRDFIWIDWLSGTVIEIYGICLKRIVSVWVRIVHGIAGQRWPGSCLLGGSLMGRMN